MNTIRFHKNQSVIFSVEDWFAIAPPKKGAKHWVDGRSAKELAKAWFPQKGQPQVPEELRQLLDSCPQTEGFVFLEGLPEHQVRLDNFGGETRNTDLVLLGYTGKQQKAVVSIEAKADEPFDVTITQRLKTGRARQGSNVPQRIELLCQAIFGSSPDTTPALGELRYQLLTGVAGALIETQNRKAALALFVVHEFRSGKVRPENLLANSNDWFNFVRLLPTCADAMPEDGKLVGPIHVPGGIYVPSGVPLYVGKAVRDLATCL